MDASPRISNDGARRTLAIIPALNEELSLPSVLADLARWQPSADVLVVDDGSTDATAQVAREHGAIVVRLPFNLGVGSALRTGFRYADLHGYERAFQFDADGQHSAAEVASLMAQLDGGADLVIGTRFSAGGTHHRYRVSRTRGVAMGMLRGLLRLMTGRKITDTSSGFRGFSGPMISQFAHSYPREYLSDTVEAIVIAAYGGFTICEVPVHIGNRVAGLPSNRSFKLAFNFMRLVLVLLTRISIRARRQHAAVEA